MRDGEPTKDRGPSPAADGASRSPSGGRVGWWVYALAWLLCYTVWLAAFVLNAMPLGFAARGALANILTDAFLGVFVLQLPRRLPWPDGPKARFFAAHFAILVSYLVVATVGWVALVTLDGVYTERVLRVRFEPRFLPWRVLNELLIYGALAGLSYAWHNAAASRAQAARAARAEVLRARAELEAMRSQLNPHFILNTFHALVGLVRRDPEVAEQAIERLGDMLRYSLRVQREGLDEVTLREEWAFVQSYLDLERLRLGDRLRVSFDAPGEALEFPVPSFALQTLVENAIRHAIAPRAEGGRLAIRATPRDGRLSIQVEDEGPGSSAAPADEGHGVGLRLLRERLAALYEGRASLELRAATPGTCAVLELPDRRALETA